MRNSINIPVVWLALAKIYSARHFHIYQPQSGRFDDLSEDELRRWIRKRLHFDRIWEAQTLQPRFRTLHEPPGGSLTTKLVPGGRWLLADGGTVSVWYCDLDSKELEWKLLTEPSEDTKHSDQDVCALETYIDLDMSGLNFNLAIRTHGACFHTVECSAVTIFHLPENLDNPTATEWLHVWQVTIKDGDDLTAKCLSSFPTSFGIEWCCDLAIGRRTVVRAKKLLSDTVIEIYRWQQCSTTGVLRSHFLVPFGIVCEYSKIWCNFDSDFNPQDTIYLIGDDRIVCTDMEGVVNLYNIPEPEYISIEQSLESHQDLPKSEPIWSYRFPRFGRICYSPLYHGIAICRFTASTSKGIWGFTVSTTEDHIPSAILLSPSFDSTTLCVPGLYKAFGPSHVDKNSARLWYGWESNEGGSGTMKDTRGEISSDPSHFMEYAFDEESGRFVYCQRDTVVILDFLDTEYQY